jgi:hypothetical protein
MGEVFDEIAAWIGRERMFLGRDGAERQRRRYPANSSVYPELSRPSWASTDRRRRVQRRHRATADELRPLRKRAIQLERLLASPIFVRREGAIARVPGVDAVDDRGLCARGKDRKEMNARGAELAADDAYLDAGENRDVIPTLRGLGEGAGIAALQMVGDADDPEVVSQSVEEGGNARLPVEELGRIVDPLIAWRSAPVVATGRVNVERDWDEERAPLQLFLEEVV